MRIESDNRIKLQRLLTVEDIIDSLTTDQLIQLLEAKGGYSGEWTEFDAEDEDTWPNHNQRVLALLNRPIADVLRFYTDSFIGKAGDYYCYTQYVTHWTPLPTFKGE